MKTIYEWTGEFRSPKKGEWFVVDLRIGPEEAMLDFKSRSAAIVIPRQIDEVESE